MGRSCLDFFGDYPAALRLLDACRNDPGDWQATGEDCQVLRFRCGVLRKLQRYEAARQTGQEGLALARRLGLREEEAWTLIELATLHSSRGLPREAAHLAKKAVSVADQTGEPTVRATARIRLAGTLRGSNPSRAEQLLGEALTLCRWGGDVRTEARILEALGDAARRQHRSTEAMARVNEAIAIFERIRFLTGEGIARQNRGLILHQMGAPHAAEALTELQRALRIAYDLGHPREVASSLVSLAKVFDKPETAALAAACYQTSLDMHTRMGLDWKKGRLYLDKLREAVQVAEADWARLEQEVANQRMPLLEQASGIGADSWREFLASCVWAAETGTTPAVK